MHGVYAIVNRINGKRYVGSSHNTPRRLGWHRSRLLLGRPPNRHLQSAWNKYGETAFEFRHVETCRTPEDALRAEQVWLDWSRCEYNIATDAQAPSRGRRRIHSQETREKISTSLRGRTQTAEARAKNAASQIGKKMSPEAIAKSAAARRGQKRPTVSEKLKGHVVSAETRERISATKRGVPLAEETRAKKSAAMRSYWAAKRRDQL